MAERRSLKDSLSKLREDATQAEKKNKQLRSLGEFPDYGEFFREFLGKLGRVERHAPGFSAHEQKDLLDLVGPVQDNLSRLASFTISDSQSYYYQQSFDRFAEASRRFFALATPIAFEAILRRLDDRGLEEKQDKIEELARIFETTSKGELANLSQVLVSLRKEAEQTVQKEIQELRNASAFLGVESNSTHFAEEAGQLRSQAKTWLRVLWVSLGFVVAVTLLSVALVTQDGIDWRSAGGARSVSVLVLVFTAASYSTYFASRNFRAAMHNYTVTRHRVNALNTFSSFVYAAKGDAQTRAAVLLQATSTVFGPQSSGYLDVVGRDHPSPVVEVINRVVQGKDSSQG